MFFLSVSIFLKHKLNFVFASFLQMPEHPEKETISPSAKTMKSIALVALNFLMRFVFIVIVLSRYCFNHIATYRAFANDLRLFPGEVHYR